MANQLISVGLWYFLPDFLSGHIQTGLYTIFIRAGDPKPAPGSTRFIRDRRRIRIGVILVYLLYTLYEADYQILQQSDFYQLLGVPHDVTEKALLSRFRRLTVLHHPDKDPASEPYYMQLKVARDILSDPVKRFAYDRFGPDILSWQQRSKTLPDYIFAGLQTSAVHYAGLAIGLVLAYVLGYLRRGMFWRFFVMATLFTLEAYLATRPHFPALLTRFLNPALTATGVRPAPYLPFQIISLSRKCAVTFFIALSQLGPLIQQQSPVSKADENGGDAAVIQLLNHVDALSQAMKEDCTRLAGLEIAPFMGDPSAAADAKSCVKEWLVQNTIRNDPEVKVAIGTVAERRRGSSLTAANGGEQDGAQ